MNILIIGPSWVGDMVMSNSLFQNLKILYPNSQIDVLAPSWCQDIVKKMPEINQIINMPLKHGELNLPARKNIAKSITNFYQRAIILPNSFKSALIPFLAKIPIRTGWKGEMRYWLLNDLRKLDKKKYPKMIMRYNALAFPKNHPHEPQNLLFPYPRLIVTNEELQNTIKQLQSIDGFSTNQPFIAICPGAEFGPAKCWPHYHYAQLSNLFINLGYKICILGSSKDKKIALKIIDQIKNKQECIDLTGKTRLNEVVNILSLAQGVVSNDSGLMHIAAALKLPLVALYGPTSPELTPPLSDKAKVIRLIQGYIPIRHSEDSPEGYHQSLIDIRPEMVYQELSNII